MGKKREIVFINSSGRSGTKSLFQVFNSIPGIQAYHGAKPILEKANNFRYHGWRVNKAIQELKNFRTPLVKRALQNNKHFVECTWFLTAMTKDIVNLFPNCKMVHLVRDGRDFVRSGMARPWFTEDPSYLNTKHAYSRDRFRPPKECSDQFEKICWLWSTQQRLMRKAMQEIPAKNNAGTWKMEDLLGKNLVPLFNLLNLIPENYSGEPLFMTKANATKKLTIPHWKNWGVDLRCKAKQWMSEEMVHYGYKWEEDK